MRQSKILAAHKPLMFNCITNLLHIYTLIMSNWGLTHSSGTLAGVVEIHLFHVVYILDCLPVYSAKQLRVGY